MYELYPGQRATGEVLLDNENILAPGNDLNLLRARIGMVFQKPTPFPMSIYENIAFGVRLYEKIPKDRKSTRLNSSHTVISYAVFCLKKKKKKNNKHNDIQKK